MLGPASEYELEDCPKGQMDADKGADRGAVRKVAFDYQGRCDFADKCIIPCEHKKEMR